LTTTIQNVDNYLHQFTDLSRRAAGTEQPWRRKLRDDAFARFCETGFPTTHDEDWRFTNISAIARTPFLLAGTPPHVAAEQLKPWRMKKAAIELVFVDGHFSRSLSHVGSLPAGVEILSLQEQLAKDGGSLEGELGRYLDVRRDAFAALNTAFAEDGAFIRLQRGIVLKEPVRLLFVSSAAGFPRMVHPRNLLVFAPESQAEVIEEYVSLGDGAVLSNSVTELVAGENSTIAHYLVEREHVDAFNISTLRMQMARSANVASHSLLLGGGLVRNNVHPVLAGDGGECLINGLFVGDGRQHLDNYMHVEHASPHCSSRQFYNGILDGRAHGVFHGRIVVHKDAQKTDAKQTNRNLLLSDDSQIDTKPQLEIYADDVKCTHGATIGQIEENALFYLRSRGIDEVSARRMLLMAFANECLDRMTPGAARDHSEKLIHEHLLRFAAHIGGATGSEKERSWEEVG
jgi:Fe-S cluster assembly protein SufD